MQKCTCKEGKLFGKKVNNLYKKPLKKKEEQQKQKKRRKKGQENETFLLQKSFIVM